MHFMRLRHYHPELRCFIEPDPIGYAGGLNLYAYVGNNLRLRSISCRELNLPMH